MMRAAPGLRIALGVAMLALPLAWSVTPCAAQSRSGGEPRATQRTTTGNVPNAVQGFSKNRHQPIQIEASSLEVQDKAKVATFRGRVHVKQGDTELRCDTLVVHYEDSDKAGTNGAQAGPQVSEQQRIRLLEAKGNVIVTQKDQTATGNSGVFDMSKNTITLRGNVVVSQGRNVLRGDRLVVDMATAVSHMESDRGRVQGLFQPSGRESDNTSPMPRLR
jgi:lipopolysaccharide export system protein LptA